jgi:hypothetical protein
MIVPEHVGPSYIVKKNEPVHVWPVSGEDDASGYGEAPASGEGNGDGLRGDGDGVVGTGDGTGFVRSGDGDGCIGEG